MKFVNKKETDCPLCKEYGLHYAHHVFGASNKRNSEKYGAVIYPCDKCHIWGTNSIHKQQSQEVNKRLKYEHRDRIISEYNLTRQQFIDIFGRAEW